MKENEVNGLNELRNEYSKKLANLKDYQDIRNEFENKSMALIKEAARAKGIKPEVFQPLAVGGCGFCTTCISSCISCVFHVAE
ncbi:MAG: hypothetical protein ABR985_13475 [Methanotrichaceae archaeon]|jgi:heterodisulfide reductase subunit C